MNNFSNNSPELRVGIRPALAVGVLAAALFSAGCDAPQTRVYTVPAETYSPADAAAPEVAWQTPSDWVEIPSTGMRFTTFLAEGAHGHDIDISVTPIAGMMGSELDNVNRWRGQVQLGPISESELAKQTVETPVGEETGRLYDMESEEKIIHGAHKQRILAAALTKPGRTWYFKMTGDDEGVGKQKEAFIEFLKTVQISESEIPAAPSGMAGMMSPHGDLSTGTPPAPAAPRAGTPDWEMPEGWATAPPANGMVLAAFEIEGAPVQATVSRFPGDVGGIFANVQRWRRQAGQPPFPESDLGKFTKTLEIEGVEATFVDTSGVDPANRDTGSQRIIAVIVNDGSNSWFYKLMGGAEATQAQQENLIKLVKSGH